MCTACEVVGASLDSLKDIRTNDCWIELSQAPAGDDFTSSKEKENIE